MKNGYLDSCPDLDLLTERPQPRVVLKPKPEPSAAVIAQAEAFYFKMEKRTRNNLRAQKNA